MLPLLLLACQIARDPVKAPAEQGSEIAEALEGDLSCDAFASLGDRPEYIGERCSIQAAQKRCSKADRCLLQMLADQGHPEIGGGAWHACYAYRAPMPEEEPDCVDGEPTTVE